MTGHWPAWLIYRLRECYLYAATKSLSAETAVETFYLYFNLCKTTASFFLFNMESQLTISRKPETETRSPNLQLAFEFPIHWSSCTDDNNLSLFSFRRFRSTHLINLRFLEEEISKVDREIYQAGLQLEIDPEKIDKLGLRSATRDHDAPSIEETITPDNILKLRHLLKDYGMHTSMVEIRYPAHLSNIIAHR